ncbi:YbhB/YbcL family Raf kinase inhibitor-like protein [Bradyrhizobium sp. AZCC 2289]|jgi:phosphatidylethanolamine-binding protein (PEBP) family uncharacterized protein|uniref:YbhB/YbcL family Raf kinase inhibitor-like protein n=1 Tax=Bradyrhizobium sp. AZCC 2289 TaxID=3117026 RepID=UPI00306870B9
MKAAWLGRLLRGVHAGEAKLAWSSPAFRGVPETLRLTSSAFAPEGPIPRMYSGRGVGENISPPLEWSPPPPDAVELILVVEDPDAPLPRPFVHLLAYGISPDRRSFGAGELSNGAGQVLFGRNTGHGAGYAGPRALPAHGPHRYYFELFALSQSSGLPAGVSLRAALRSVAPFVIARGRLVGTFER